MHLSPLCGIPLIADMVFEGQHFHAMGPLSSEVPILTIGGIAKQYVVPGWRVGWLIVHDKKDRLVNVRESCNMLSQLILGANSLAHAALPEIFAATPKVNVERIP
jgi:tyrosine aminotransferase